MDKRKIIKLCRTIEFWSLAVLVVFVTTLGIAKGFEFLDKEIFVEERHEKINQEDFCKFLKEQGAPGCFICRGENDCTPWPAE